MSILRGHLLGLEPLTSAQILALLELAEEADRGHLPADALRGRVVANVFYEPSTRTRTSFELAARRLGATVVNFDPERSSVQKGESLLDTILTLEALGADAVVLRHPCSGAAHQLSRSVRCSVVNAGDGMHEHPTQALVDLFTLRRTFGRIAGLRVVIVGDVLHSRVARSAWWGLSKLGAEVVFCGPPPLVPAEFERLGARVCHRLEEALVDADVVMALRMQTERQLAESANLAEYHRFYGLTPERLQQLAPAAVVMHPGPANLGAEVTPATAYGERSLILDQVRNGVSVRSAVLYDLLVEQAEPAAPKPLQTQHLALSGSGRL